MLKKSVQRPIESRISALSNGLENFEIEEETPELFNSESEDSFTNETSVSKETNDLEEDDLEIPAFLRRQKN